MMSIHDPSYLEKIVISSLILGSQDWQSSQIHICGHVDRALNNNNVLMYVQINVDKIIVNSKVVVKGCKRWTFFQKL